MLFLRLLAVCQIPVTSLAPCKLLPCQQVEYLSKHTSKLAVFDTALTVNLFRMPNICIYSGETAQAGERIECVSSIKQLLREAFGAVIDMLKTTDLTNDNSKRCAEECAGSHDCSFDHCWDTVL